ncbi:Oncoprotein-induced transcript 3 protein [Branchiostoma belcheri]|nr:Oncoprotein-induced transcript 3 protein [Branchiostoma belcheri]
MVSQPRVVAVAVARVFPLGGDTVSDKELEALRILHRLSVALKNNGGGIGDAKGGKPDVYDGGPDDDTDEETEDTEGTNLVTEDADGDTEGTDGDTEGTDGDADGDTEDTNGDSEGTDGFTEDADGDAEGTDTVTGDADGDAEGTDGDTGGTDGDTGDANGDAEGTDGDTGGTDGDTGDANGDAEGTDGDTGAPMETPETLMETPRAPMETPGAPMETPKTLMETPRAPMETPGAPMETPETLMETPRAQMETPRAPMETPKTLMETPRAQMETPRAPMETPRAQMETPRAQMETPRTQMETPRAPMETPETLVETPETLMETPETLMETPETLMETPRVPMETLVETPETLMETPETLIETPETLMETPETLIETPETLMETPRAPMETPETLMETPRAPTLMCRQQEQQKREDKMLRTSKTSELRLTCPTPDLVIASVLLPPDFQHGPKPSLVRNVQPFFLKRGRSAGADELSFQSRRQNSDPCNSYRVLNQPWRSVDIPGYKGKCDNGFNGEWYRFMSPAGTSMPTQPPPTDYRCGTHAPIWMNGQHPSVADGEVSRQTCALWGSNPCVAGWTSPIRVKACSAGYYVYKLPGVRCHLTYCATDFQDVCFPSPCENGDCVVAANNYTCNCRSGFEGGRCERDIDGCSPNPCDAEATCADIPAPGIGANCTCRSGFVGDGRSSGSRCTRAGEKIIFPGPRDVDDYARMETTLSGDLTSFTLCVHMRSNMASSNQISLVSYAVSQHNNELLLFVNGGFQLYIQSDIRMADPPVWDGEWHTVCTTWRSRDGAWQFYVDGDLTASGSGFRVGGRVRRGGTWILGQDQDRVGGGFEASQSFIGELSEVNLWDRVLSSAEIAADCSYHGNVIDWETTNIRVFGEASKAEYHRCASTTCSNDYMELSIPEDQLTDIDLNNLHWRPDRNCGATTNGSHYLFRTELYDCGTEVTFGAKYVTFLNTINILGTHLNSGVITREGDIWITSKCNYERKEWVDSTFLPIPGGLNFTEEGFGQLEVRLSMFPTRQYLRQYRADQYPIHLRLRQHVYMQLEVQGHAQKLSVLALNCKATMSPSPNDSLQYQLIRDGCASDPTLKTYDVDDPGKERFGFEAFRFIREVRTVYVHCEVLVCDAADSGSRCAQGCVRRGKRAAGEVDMRGRHMIYQGPIVLDDDKEAEHAVRLVDDQETGPARRGAPWAMLAAGCVLAALVLVVLGTAIVQKRSRRGEWAYHGLKHGE